VSPKDLRSCDRISWPMNNNSLLQRRIERPPPQ
jgi:hypothetical protein